MADNTYRDGSSELNNTEASFITDGGVSVDQRKMNAGGSNGRALTALSLLILLQSELILNGFQFGGCFVVSLKECANRPRQVEMDDNLRIWRSFSIGSLLDLIMLDTRQYDRSITDLYWNTEYIKTISDDSSRSLMGSRQENWFYQQLIQSSKRGAAWRIIGSQISTYDRIRSHAWG